jgi:hypothetical protein
VAERAVELMGGSTWFQKEFYGRIVHSYGGVGGGLRMSDEDRKGEDRCFTYTESETDGKTDRQTVWEGSKGRAANL